MNFGKISDFYHKMFKRLSKHAIDKTQEQIN